MDDKDFFDTLYKMWSHTTNAADRFWDYHGDVEGAYTIRSIGPEGESTPLPVAEGLFECDADWITALHGCFPDLVRRLHAALDEADRADFEKDSRECRIAELESELIEANYINCRLRQEYAELQSEVETLRADLEGLLAR
jgi:hypothetical protein